MSLVPLCIMMSLFCQIGGLEIERRKAKRQKSRYKCQRYGELQRNKETSETERAET